MKSIQKKDYETSVHKNYLPKAFNYVNKYSVKTLWKFKQKTVPANMFENAFEMEIIILDPQQIDISIDLVMF